MCIFGLTRYHGIPISVAKVERDEYFSVKAMFSNPNQCIRAAMYAPFELEDKTGSFNLASPPPPTVGQHVCITSQGK